MADGGNAAPAALAAPAVANEQVTPMGYAAKPEMYEVNTACTICGNPYNVGTGSRRPYRTCSRNPINHYLCGECLKAMLETKNWGKGAVNE